MKMYNMHEAMYYVTQNGRPLEENEMDVKRET